jgi:hypothetical protein
MGREWGEDGEGEVSSQATWGQGGRDRTTQEEGFQVSNREWQGELAEGSSKGNNGELRRNLTLVICIYVSYHV